MTVHEQQPPKTRISRGRIVLAVSLAFNLLIIGMFVGAHLSGAGPGRGSREAAAKGTGMGFYGRALSRDDRQAVFASLRASQDETSAARQAMRDLGGEIVQALGAEPFDAAKLTELMQKQRAAAGDLAAIGQGVLEAHIATMPATERAAFAERLREGLNRRRRRPRS